MYSTTLVFEEIFVQTAFAVVSCAVPGLSGFYSIVCFHLTNQGVRYSRRTPAGIETRNRQDNRAEPQPVSADVTCAVPGLSAFYSLVVSIQPTWVCAVRSARLLGSTARMQRDIRSGCFCSCKLRCCRPECVLLLGFNKPCNIFAVMIAWS